MNRERLQLKFTDENSKDFSLSVANFKSNLNKETVQTVAAEMIAANVLANDNALAKQLKEANIVTVSINKLV